MPFVKDINEETLRHAIKHGTLDEVIRQVVIHRLRDCNGIRNEAARSLAVDRTTMLRWLHLWKKKRWISAAMIRRPADAERLQRAKASAAVVVQPPPQIGPPV